MTETNTGKDSAKITKRQRRAQLKSNDKHRWPQHPNIKQADRRAQAYIRTAGLLPTSKGSDLTKSSSTEVTSASISSSSSDKAPPEVKFGRLLGGPDARIRHRAVLGLKEYLTNKCTNTVGSGSSSSSFSGDNEDTANSITSPALGISELDLLKLAKALHMTLYLCDHAPVQQELCKHAAKLLWAFQGTLVEDEYAGQVYMDMYSSDEDEEEEETGDDDSSTGSQEGGSGESGQSSDDEEDVQLEELINTLEDSEGDEENEDSSNESMEDGDEIVVNDSEIPHCRGAHLASLFIRTMLRTIRREWGNMDKYRVDKFYSLLRCLCHEVYEYMAQRHWNLGIIRLFNDAIFEEVLSQTPNGLRYHLVDIALDELAKVNAEAPMPLTEATFLDCLEPYFAMAQTGGAGGENGTMATANILQARAVEQILRKFLEKYSVASDCDIASTNSKDEEESNDPKNQGDENLIMDQVHVGTIAEFIFSLGSDGATKDSYRKSLYDMHKDYLRRLKQAGRDVDINIAADDDEENNLATEEQIFAGGVFCHDVGDEEDIDAMEKEVVEEEVVTEERKETKSSKKKKKKRKKSSEGEADGQMDTETTENEESRPSKKSKERKRARIGDATKSKADVAEEEEITITVADQKAAKTKLAKTDKVSTPKEDIGKKEKKNKKQKKSKADQERGSDSKKVVFRRSNTARSWKASMKGLHTMESPVGIKSPPPEKSILLNKTTPIVIRKQKGKRRAASSYF